MVLQFTIGPCFWADVMLDASIIMQTKIILVIAFSFSYVIYHFSLIAERACWITPWRIPPNIDFATSTNSEDCLWQILFLLSYYDPKKC